MLSHRSGWPWPPRPPAVAQWAPSLKQFNSSWKIRNFISSILQLKVFGILFWGLDHLGINGFHLWWWGELSICTTEWKWELRDCFIDSLAPNCKSEWLPTHCNMLWMQLQGHAVCNICTVAVLPQTCTYTFIIHCRMFFTILSHQVNVYE